MVTGSDNTHSPRGASSAHRWMYCPGSVAASAHYPPSSSVYAEEGTRAHEIALEALVHEKPVDCCANYEDTFAQVLDYVTYIREIQRFAGERLRLTWFEVRLDYSAWVADGQGTGDCVMLWDGTLDVIDLKYGQGVKVFADGEQLKLYALGAYEALSWIWPVRNIRLHIVQPRLGHIDVHEMSVDELLEFANEAKIASLLTLDPDALRIPGQKQCRWCAHRTNCPELAAYMRELMAPSFQNLDIETLDHDVKLEILKHKKSIMDYIHALEEEAIATLREGRPYDGAYLGEGRSLAKWSENAEHYLVNALGNQAYRESLITITEARKHLPKDVVDSLTIKPQGKPVLLFGKGRTAPTNLQPIED